MLKPEIIFEDEWLLLINKPAGVVVNRAASVSAPTIQDWAETYIPWDWQRQANELEKLFKARLGIAHRLDKDTSGVLVLGKTPEALSHLMRQFKERTMAKEYRALAHGKVEPQEGYWRLPISRSVYNRHKFTVNPMGKMAHTDYRVLGNYTRNYNGVRSEIFSWLALFPKTGRTHQLRVHLSFMKHPLVGDSLYASEKQIASDITWCPRHFLHAARLQLQHPRNGEQMTVEAPLAADLQPVLAGLVADA